MVAPTIIEILFGVARLNLGQLLACKCGRICPYGMVVIAHYADILKQTVIVYFTVCGVINT